MRMFINKDFIPVGLLILSICFLSLILMGCRSVRRGEPFNRAIEAKTPEIKRGELVYMQHCHSCHPGGEGGLGPGLNDKPLPVFLMKTQVRAGLGVMPSFDQSQISPEELDDLMVYIVALRKQ